MEREAYLTLSNMDAVTETHALYGEYDLVACVKADSAKELTQLLMGNLRTIDGIKETETLIVVED